MSRLIRFHPEAIRELEDVAAELGRSFADRAQRILEQISELPSSSPIWPGRRDVRQRVLTKWPYSVMYTVDATSVFIAAVAHQKRAPGYWLSRL